MLAGFHGLAIALGLFCVCTLQLDGQPVLDGCEGGEYWRVGQSAVRQTQARADVAVSSGDQPSRCVGHPSTVCDGVVVDDSMREEV